jgi:conjugative transfer region protein TrbK
MNATIASCVIAGMILLASACESQESSTAINGEMSGEALTSLLKRCRDDYAGTGEARCRAAAEEYRKRFHAPRSDAEKR